MILYKTQEEIELIRESSLLVSKTLGIVAECIKPGISTLALDKIAEEYIRDNNAEPGFLGYNDYPNTLCTSVNSVVVHGIPNNKELVEGDIISVDVGVLKNGFYGDSAYTFAVGEISREKQDLLTVTETSLFKGIEIANEGMRLGDIGFTIQKYCEDHGYSVVRELVGHGIGKNMHEEPEVANYGRRGTGPKLKNNLVICIEPMINMGVKHIKQENDGWTIRTTDNQPSAHFELTIAINNNKADVLSTFKYIEDIINKN